MSVDSGGGTVAMFLYLAQLTLKIILNQPPDRHVTLRGYDRQQLSHEPLVLAETPCTIQLLDEMVE